MESPIKITEAERPLRSERPAHPLREVWRLMHDHAAARRADRDAGRRRLTEQQERLAALVVEMVNVQHQLAAYSRTLRGEPAADGGQAGEQAEMLAALGTKLLKAANRAGATVLAPEGEPYDPDMDTWAEILASVPDPGVERPVVRETVRPGVLLGSELVQSATILLATPVLEEQAAQAPAADDGEPGKSDEVKSDA